VINDGEPPDQRLSVICSFPYGLSVICSSPYGLCCGPPWWPGWPSFPVKGPGGGASASAGVTAASARRATATAAINFFFIASPPLCAGCEILYMRLVICQVISLVVRHPNSPPTSARVKKGRAERRILGRRKGRMPARRLLAVANRLGIQILRPAHSSPSQMRSLISGRG